MYVCMYVLVSQYTQNFIPITGHSVKGELGTCLRWCPTKTSLSVMVVLGDKSEFPTKTSLSVVVVLGDKSELASEKSSL